MRIGDKRETRAARTVAEERKLPRPIKELVLAYHEDAKGKKISPAITRRFWVVGGVEEKVCVHMDAQGNEHRFTILRGELDFTSRVRTVTDIEMDEDGNVLTVTDISHEPQFRLNTTASNFQEGKLAYYHRTPQTRLCRFVVHGKRRADILTHWQRQADSPDATWVDGREPSVEQMEALQAEWDARGKKDSAKEAVGAGPTDPSEVEGENWST